MGQHFFLNVNIIKIVEKYAEIRTQLIFELMYKNIANKYLILLVNASLIYYHLQ